MVLKLSVLPDWMYKRFENDVKMYGTQACYYSYVPNSWFENDVKMYGTQAIPKSNLHIILFENDVKMYGTQAVCRFIY